MMLYTIFLVLLGTFAVRVIADGGYSGNCNNVSLVDLGDAHIGLRAYCNAGASAHQCSILDLNYCYGTTGESRRLSLEEMDKSFLMPLLPIQSPFS
ncbi:hypothetical protein GGR52DRAFT_558598 [Hypoxylon sp. FL1284]|nr:hypothetical protein GGR52DRAFT_558598 [Hypoxylon sp. FL1284]